MRDYLDLLINVESSIVTVGRTILWAGDPELAQSSEGRLNTNLHSSFSTSWWQVCCDSGVILRPWLHCQHGLCPWTVPSNKPGCCFCQNSYHSNSVTKWVVNKHYCPWHFLLEHSYLHHEFAWLVNQHVSIKDSCPAVEKVQHPGLNGSF